MNITYDYSKLLGRIREKGYTQKSLAEAIGIHPATLNLKLANKTEFSQGEMVAIGELLELDSLEPYFFYHTA